MTLRAGDNVSSRSRDYVVSIMYNVYLTYVINLFMSK